VKKIILLTAVIFLAGVALLVQLQKKSVSYQTIPAGYYQNFLSSRERNEQEVLCALIRTPEEYDILFHPAAVMPIRIGGEMRPFFPDKTFYDTNQIIVVAREMPAPEDGRLNKVFAVDKIIAKNGNLLFYYTFKKPQNISAFSVNNYLAVRIPKEGIYKKVLFFENGKNVGNLNLTKDEWVIPSALY